MLRFVVALGLVALSAAQAPNEKLKQCCSTLKDADKECVERFCDFNAISQTNVSVSLPSEWHPLQVLNYLSTCQERGPTVGNMWDCVSLRHDHSDCCKKKGVADGCLPYCRAQNGVPTNYLDYLFCMEDFNLIRDCFHDHLEKNEPYRKA